MAGPVHLVGIAGPSGSGKSAVAQALCQRLPGAAGILPVDAYYRDLGALAPADRASVNFDHPEAIDHERLVGDLGRLAGGEAVARPVYRFATHTRAPETARVEPTPFSVVEGILTLHWEAIRRLLHTAVFVDLADEACLARRLARDVAERGRTAEAVRAQYAETVRPMRERYVMPTRRFADLVVSGAAPLDESVGRILAHIGGGRGEAGV
jgi:uridine kinase